MMPESSLPKSPVRDPALRGGGMLELDPVGLVPLPEEESVEVVAEDGRMGVPAAARIASVAVQAIGILTDANAAPAWPLILTLPVIVLSAVNVIVAVPATVVALSVLIVPPDAMKSTVVPSAAGLPAASLIAATTNTVPPQRSTAPGLAVNVIEVAAAGWAAIGVPWELEPKELELGAVGVGQNTWTRTSFVPKPAADARTRALVIPG
jgi:hypothetical protein